MTNDFRQSRYKLIGLYLFIIAVVVSLFSFLIVYQARDSFSDPAVKTNSEIILTAQEAETLAQGLRPSAIIVETEYEIEKSQLYYTISFSEEDEVKVNLLTGEVLIPDENVGLVETFTDDFDEMVGWIGLFVFFAASLLSMYVVNKTLAPLQENMRKQKQFVSDAAHELRNPLSALHARIESVIRLGKKEFNTDVFTDLLQETKHLITLSEDLLSLEKNEVKRLQKGEVSVIEVTRSILHRLAHLIEKKHIRCTISAIVDTPLISTQSELETILYNLIHNALKFTPEYGSIEIGWNGKVLFVSDTGIGIDEKDTALIFNRFHKVDTSRTGEGSGLGLALVKEILMKHGGRIEVKSTLGKGTTMSVQF